MVKHNHGNAPLTGTYTDNECGFVADQNSKKKNLQSKTKAKHRGDLNPHLQILVIALLAKEQNN